MGGEKGKKKKKKDVYAKQTTNFQKHAKIQNRPA